MTPGITTIRKENIFRGVSVGCEDNDALYHALYP